MLLGAPVPPHDLAAGEIYVQAKADMGISGGLAVSGLSGAGVDDLIALIAGELGRRVASVGLAMRERHRLALLRAVTSLDDAGAGLDAGHGMLDLIAEDLRTAIRAVDSLVGRVDVEQVLDEIFFQLLHR
jgi:Predicted GTPase